MNFSDLHLDVAPLCKTCGVKTMAVFGSFARGDARKDSDLDVIVDLVRQAVDAIRSFCRDRMIEDYVSDLML